MAGCGDACDRERLYRNPLHRGQGGGWQLTWVWVEGQESKDLETPAEKDTASAAKERQGANAWVFHNLCVESPNF